MPLIIRVQGPEVYNGTLKWTGFQELLLFFPPFITVPEKNMAVGKFDAFIVMFYLLTKGFVLPKPCLFIRTKAVFPTNQRRFVTAVPTTTNDSISIILQAFVLK